MKCKSCGEDYPSKIWFRDENPENICIECYKKEHPEEFKKEESTVIKSQKPQAISKNFKMKSRISIVMLIIGLLLSIVGGYLVYDAKYHRLFLSSEQEFQAMIPGIVIAIIGLGSLVIGIITFITSGKSDNG